MSIDPDIRTVVISTGDGGLQPGTRGEAVTPGMLPNIAYKVIGPLAAILVRFAHLYFVTLLGAITGAAAGHAVGVDLMPFADFADLLMKSSQLALATPLVGLIKDLITIFGRLENKFPFLTGNV